MVAFTSTSVAIATLTTLAFWASPVVGATCHVVGWIYNGDSVEDGGTGENTLSMYNAQNQMIGSYNGDYAPNCCQDSSRTTDLDSSLPYVFEYTPQMDETGTAITGCQGNYGSQTNMQGVVDSSYVNEVVTSAVSSSCTIAFNC